MVGPGRLNAFWDAADQWPERFAWLPVKTIDRGWRWFIWVRQERGTAAFSLWPTGNNEIALRHIFGSHEVHWAYHRDGWYNQKFMRYLGTLGFDQLRFEQTHWQATHNITVEARKQRLLAEDEALRAADDLLVSSLIDRSGTELRICEVWKVEMRRRLALVAFAEAFSGAIP